MDTKNLLRDYLNLLLLSLGEGSIRFFACKGDNSEKGHPGKEVFPFYQAQGHGFCEIIFSPLAGVLIYLDGTWINYPGGEVWVLLPPVAHSERCKGGRANYDLLWLTVTSHALGMHITGHRRKKGYFVRTPRLAFHPTVQTTLAEMFNAGNSFSFLENFERVRVQGLLIEAVWQMRTSLEQPETPVLSYQQQVVERLLVYIDEHYCAHLSLTELAEMFHYTPCYLNTLFRRQTGQSIHQHILERRLQQAVHLVLENNCSIKQIAYRLGFSDPLYFSRLYRKRHGTSPAGERARHFGNI